MEPTGVAGEAPSLATPPSKGNAGGGGGGGGGGGLSALYSRLTHAWDRPSSAPLQSPATAAAPTAPTEKREVTTPAAVLLSRKPAEEPVHTRAPSGEAAEKGKGAEEEDLRSSSTASSAAPAAPAPADSSTATTKAAAAVKGETVGTALQESGLPPPPRKGAPPGHDAGDNGVAAGTAAALAETAAGEDAAPLGGAREEPLISQPAEGRRSHRRPNGSSSSLGGGRFQSPPPAALQHGVSEDGDVSQQGPITPMGGNGAEESSGQIAYLKSHPSRRVPRGSGGFADSGAAGGGGGGEEVIYLADIDAVPGSADPSDIVVLEHRRRVRVKRDRDGQKRAGRGALTPRSRTPTRKRRQSARRKKGIGKPLHPTDDYDEYMLSMGMMLGLRVAVGRQENPLESSELHIEDFYLVDKYVLPPRGARTGPLRTPSHSLGHTFKFKDYAPKVFKRIRENFGVDRSQYMLSVAGNYNLLEFMSNAKSGAFLFYSHDERFVIKTMKPSETKFFRRILPHYYEHVRKNPDTFLVRFYGMYRVKMHHLHRRVHFIVMNSVFDTHKELSRQYDLKGSTLGRVAKGAEKVKKDMDMMTGGRKIHLGPQRDAFLQVIKEDAAFLSRMKIMDYSLLLGVHDRTAPPDRTDWATGGSPRRYSRFMNFVDEPERERDGDAAAVRRSAGGGGGDVDATAVRSSANGGSGAGAGNTGATAAAAAAAASVAAARVAAGAAPEGQPASAATAGGDATYGPTQAAAAPTAGAAAAAATAATAATAAAAAAAAAPAAVAAKAPTAGKQGSGTETGGAPSDGRLSRVAEGEWTDDEEGATGEEGENEEVEDEEDGKEPDGDGGMQDFPANASTEWDETEDEADYSDFASGGGAGAGAAKGGGSGAGSGGGGGGSSSCGGGGGGTDTDPDPADDSLPQAGGGAVLRPPPRVARRQVSWSAPPSQPPLSPCGEDNGAGLTPGGPGVAATGPRRRPPSAVRARCKGRLLRRRHDMGLYSYVPKGSAAAAAAAAAGTAAGAGGSGGTRTSVKATGAALPAVAEVASVASSGSGGSSLLGASSAGESARVAAGAAGAAGAAAAAVAPTEWVRGDEIYFCGIIDVLQEYNIRKHGETFIKSLAHDRNTISCIDPESYAKRFYDFLERNTD